MSAMTRRLFMGGLIVGASSCASRKPVLPLTKPFQSPDYSDAELERIFADNGEPANNGYVVKGLGDWPLWWNQQPLEMARWPADSDAIDYAHLPTSNNEGSFLLTDAALRVLFTSHGYSDALPNDGGPVLFGIRGVKRTDGLSHSASLEDRIELVETTPDHFNYRCLLGVWDVRRGTLWTATASTVPHVAYLYAQREAATFTSEANMMPTGLYRYTVGTHRNRSSSAQPGAFRPSNKAFAVVRCVQQGPLEMNRYQYWDTRDSNHGDNMHAGTYSTREDRPQFWSAGCQVIPGFYKRGSTMPNGIWALFRVAAGLESTPVITKRTEVAPGRYDIKTSDDGRNFRYLLTTGRDVRLSSEGTPAATLRFGSSGSSVVSLQAALGIPANQRDGVLGIGMQRLLLGRDEITTPIVDQAVASNLGFQI